MRRWEMRSDGEVRQVGRHGQWHACVGHPLTGAVRIGGNAGRSGFGPAGSKTREFVRSAEIIAMLVTLCRRKLN